MISSGTKPLASGLRWLRLNLFSIQLLPLQRGEKPGLIIPVFKRRARNASKSLGLCHGDEVYVEMTNQWDNAERKLEKQKFYFIGTFPSKRYHILISRGTSLRRKSNLNKFIFHYNKCVFKKWLGHLGSFITRRFTSRV